MTGKISTTNEFYNIPRDQSEPSVPVMPQIADQSPPYFPKDCKRRKIPEDEDDLTITQIAWLVESTVQALELSAQKLSFNKLTALEKKAQQVSYILL